MAITNYFTLLYFDSLENVMGTGVVLWYVVCGKTRLGCGNIGICIYMYIYLWLGMLILNGKGQRWGKRGGGVV